MKLNTIEKMYLALKELAPAIEMDEELRQRAWVPLKRMLDLS
jgi:quinolinate synthase